jgi:stage II sporulation protein D
LVVVSGGLGLAVAATLVVPPALASSPDATPFPSSNVTFVGHGNGPGYGMGQWGAFGYAALDHWTYKEILDHYYSDSSHPVTLGTLSTASDAQTIHVGIEENDGQAVAVTSPAAFTVLDQEDKTIATVPAGQAARAVDSAKTGTWDVETGSGCGKGTKWKTVASGVRDPVAVPHSQSSTAPASQLLTLCEGDGTDVTFRGKIEAYDYYGAGTNYEHYSRTINEVALEQYVADVTPSESPAGWATYGGTAKAPQGEPWGYQELEAQAVAVRTYVLYSIFTGGWYGYADICDDVCQSYFAGIANESPASNLAAKDTEGEYLVQSAAPAPTEYAASSGGYTETLSYYNGVTIFTGVRDAGDNVCIGGKGTLGCNPEHTWTTSVPVSTIQAGYPSIGRLVSVKVTAKDSSGRVTDIELLGEKGNATLTGVDFIGQFGGFLSTLFQVTNGPGATTSSAFARSTTLASSAGGFGHGTRSRAGEGVPGDQLPVGLNRG